MPRSQSGPGGHIVAATTLMSLVKPQPDNLSCYVICQLWAMMTRMKMLIRIVENFQGWRVRPSGHSHTLSASSPPSPPALLLFSLITTFSCEHPFPFFCCLFTPLLAAQDRPRPFLGPRGPLGTPLYARKKNLDQQYSSMYASQTHITIHIPKAHDMHYPLMPP